MAPKVSKVRPAPSCNDEFQAETEERMAAMTPEELHALDERNIAVYAAVQGISQAEARAWVYKRRAEGKAPPWPPARQDPAAFRRSRTDPDPGHK